MPRVNLACERCRRQKLKCDAERPCLMCVRSEVECREAIEKYRRVRVQASRRGIRRAVNQALTPHQATEPTSGRQIVPNSPCDTISTPSSTIRPPSLVESTRHVEHGVARDTEEDSPAAYFDEVSRYQLPESNHPRGYENAMIFIDRTSRRNTERTTISRLVGMELPREEVVLALFRAYLNEVHWFTLVIHEPTFRERLEEVIDAGSAFPSDHSFLLLVVAVLLLGTRCVKPEVFEQKFPDVNLTDIRQNLLEAAEARFLVSLSEGDVESMTMAFLLSQYYMHMRQVKLAYIVLGAAVQSAQAESLHKEERWKCSNLVEREVRRRLFWHLYVSDGFAAQAYGRLALLTDPSIHVEYPTDIDDNSISCPILPGMTIAVDGDLPSLNSIGAFHRCRAELYRIAAPITRDVYFANQRDTTNLIHRVHEIYDRLLLWESQVPEMLQLRFYLQTDVETRLRNEPILRCFALQALSLQVSYDNIHLLLFRPFIGTSRRSATLGGTSSSTESDIQILAYRQCWESSMRTSLADRLVRLLGSVGYTPNCLNIANHCCSAGVMLGILATATHMSPEQSQNCKEAIARIIRFPVAARMKISAWDRVAEILIQILQRVASEEVKTLIAETPRLGLPFIGGEVRPFGVLALELRADPTTIGVPTLPKVSPEEQIRNSYASAGAPPVMPGPSDFELDFNLTHDIFGDQDDIGQAWIWNENYSMHY